MSDPLNTEAEADRIIRDVCKRFEVSRADVMGRRRSWVVCWPRFIAIRLIYEATTLNQWGIAAIWGVNQSSIHNAIRSASDLEQTSAIAASDLAIMRLRLGITAKRTK